MERKIEKDTEKETELPRKYTVGHVAPAYDASTQEIQAGCFLEAQSHAEILSSGQAGVMKGI